MKVDVYPNINKVEVYENPISVPVDASWEKVLFTIEDANDTTFVLPSQPMLDRDGDFVLKVFYNAVLAEFSIDYSIDGSTITWLNRFPLEANELIEVWYAPKSAYGSVPGSGEVTSLNHLNDVSIAGPITGQLLVRNNDGKFQNKSLIAGDNVTITNDNADITIASNPNLPLSHLSANGTLENNNAYVIDTSSAPITMQLPATSTLGKVISVQRLGGEQLTISRNGHNVNALAQDITIGDGETVTFRYLDATTGWLKSSSGLTSAGGNGAVQTSDGSGGLVDSGWTISSGHLLPSLNEQYDIGSATNLVRDIYLSNNSLKFGAEGKALSVNAQNKLEFDGTELGTGSGIDGLLFSGTLSDGEVIKYNGTNWVNTPVDYTQVSNTPSLSTVATTGSYNDLDNRPSLFSGSYTDLANLPVLFSGAYGDLYNKPTLGTSSSLDVGEDANNVVQLDANARLPQVDGSQLTNVTATDSTKLAKANNLNDLADLAQARTNLGVDVAGTDNSTDVTLANVANNYLSITNQEITSGTVPISLGGTGATTAEAARTALGVDASGTDNSTNVTLANTNYLSITGQEITGGTVPVASGGTGATTAAVARANLGVDASGTDNSTNVTLANTNYLTITGQEITGGTVPVASGGTGATDATNARTNLGLGTSATLDHGTSAGNLVRLDPTTSKLPAVDGSLLTNLPSGASALNDLSDVVISNSAQNQVVVHDGNNFVNAQLAYSQVSGTPSLSAVATSGDYVDLANKPTIPTGLNSLSDVSFTAGSSIDGYVLTYSDTNSQWEALQSTGSSSVAWDEVGQADSAVDIVTTVGDITIDAQGSDTDIVFQGTDGTDHVEMLRLDASEEGKATFNGDVNLKSNRKLLFGDAGDVSIEHVLQTGLNLKVNLGSGSTEPIFSLINEGTTGSGPTLKLAHTNHTNNSATVGRVVFTGNTDASNDVDISIIKSVFSNRSDTAKHSQMVFQVYSNDSLRSGLYLDPVTNSNATVLRIADHNGVDGGLKLGATLVTASGNELNILDGATLTTTELNLLDGGTATSPSITIEDNDGFLVADSGVMKKIPASDLKTYVASSTVTNKISKNDSEVVVNDTGANGTINFKTDNASRWNITSSGHLEPASDAVYDIGSVTNKVRTLYVESNSIKFGDDEISLGVDSSGNIQVGSTPLATQSYVSTNAPTLSNNLSDLPDVAQARTNLGLASVASSGAYSSLTGRPQLGTSSSLNHGTSAGNVVKLDGTTAYLPAVDGRNLTNLDYSNITLNAPTLGTASAQNVGTSANNVVQLDASANIDVSSNSIVTASNADIDLVPNGSGKVIIHGNATSGSGQIKLNCEQNSHGIILKGPAHSATANYTLTFPDALGSNNQVLKTDTNGNLSWVDQSAGGGGGFTYDDTKGSASWTASLSTHYSVKTNNASANVTMTLPSASSAGSEIRVKLLDATHSLVIAVQTGEKLDDVTNGTTTLSVATQSVTLVDNGSNGWEIV